MNTKKQKYPVLLITHKRLKDLNLILKEIEKYRPSTLYIYSDAGRNAQEQKEVDTVRKFLNQFKNNNSKLNCSMHFNKINKGVRDGVYHAVSSAFKNEMALIILEDDCIPGKSFFKYCSYYLSLFSEDKRVLSISGTRFGKSGDPLLSKYFTSWGWATWKNRWRMLDLKLKDWEKMGFFQKVKFLHSTHHNVLGVWYWYNILEYTRRGKIVTWDYQFNFLHWYKSLYSIVPSGNLVVNKGFDEVSNNTTFYHKHIPKLLDENIILNKDISPSIKYDTNVLRVFYLFYFPVFGLIIRYVLGLNGLVKLYVNRRSFHSTKS